jgi:hypothetical protein
MSQWKDRILVVAFFAFALTFGWQMKEILSNHACWCDFKTPPGVGEVVGAITTAFGAMAAALGINVSNLVSGFMSKKEQ